MPPTHDNAIRDRSLAADALPQERVASPPAAHPRNGAPVGLSSHRDGSVRPSGRFSELSRSTPQQINVDGAGGNGGADTSGRRLAGADTRRLITYGLIATAGIALAGAAAQLIQYGVFRGSVRLLDSSTDGGLFGVVGDVSITLAAFVAWVVLLRIPSPNLGVIALPPLLTFLTIDKFARIHDHVPGRLILYVPLLAAAFVAVVAAARQLSPSSFRLTAVALGLLLGSFLLHQYGEWLVHHLPSAGGWVFQVKVALKHGSEVAGWLLISITLAIGLREHLARRVDRAGP